MYSITSHTRSQAKKYGLIVKSSKLKGKKIGVFKKTKDGLVKLADVGALSYGDFGTFKKTKGIEFANKRRKAYRSRHKNDPMMKGGKRSRAWYAMNLLW
tara:strand:+ start:1307 stop:1603 length:297 start_codon:yes stop_codon:yes gene_type:complete